MAWQSKLIRWYQTHKRDLPWRDNPTPYRVLVSEFMLQQTTVKTVIPYYKRFLKRFPSLRSLATATEDEVLTLWSGLGYYSRARNLLRAVQICRQQFSGRIPRDVASLQKLPGIGAYTAGAIASIAYEEKAAIVDGNVARVLARLLRLADDPKTPAGLRKFWAHAHAALPPRHFGDFNQALMELGATVCTPRQPSCHLCPLNRDCLAYARNEVQLFPKLNKSMTYRNVRLTASLIRHRNSFLMVQRPDHGVLRSMWEFPMIEGDIEDLQAALGVKLSPGCAMPPIHHSIMNQRLKVTPWLITKTRDIRQKPPRSRWVSIEQLQQLPVSSLVHKLTKRIN